jgi:hypothetical protein
MPRIKIFNEIDTYTLECVINDWMREEPRIRIKAIRQSNSPTRTVVSVWYDEEEDLPNSGDITLRAGNSHGHIWPFF